MFPNIVKGLFRFDGKYPGKSDFNHINSALQMYFIAQKRPENIF